MYKKPIYAQNKLFVNQATEGETIEQKMSRIINNKEPIKDGAPIIYTERKEGVKASMNIRTDRFAVAIEASDKIAKSYKGKREESAKKRAIGGPEPTQGGDDPAKNQQGQPTK